MQKQNGFTLIELMIVVAIVAILAAVGVPSYNQYMKRAEYAEVVTAAGLGKTAVETCFQVGHVATNCALQSDVATSGAFNTNIVTSVSASGNDTDKKVTITATGVSKFDSATYVLVGTKGDNGLVSWSQPDSTSTCIAKGYC